MLFLRRVHYGQTCLHSFVPSHNFNSGFFLQINLMPPPQNEQIQFDTIKWRQFTYGQLEQSIKAFAVGLHRFGAFKGDVITMALPNSFELLVAGYGAPAVGAICSGLNPAYKKRELRYHLGDANASFVFACQENWNEFDQIFAQDKAVAKSIKGAFMINMDDESIRQLPKTSGVNWMSFENLLSFGYHVFDKLPKMSVDLEHDICYLPYSSGTTGMPKGVLVTHKMMCAGEAAFMVPDRYYHAKSGDCTVLPLPMFHMFAFLVAYSLIQAGVNIIGLHKYRPDTFLGLVQQFQPKTLFTAPPLILFLAKDKMLEQYDTSSLQHVFIAAAPIGKELLEEFSKRHPNVKFIEQGFGMTECVVSHRQPKNGLNMDKAGSVGPSIANCKTKIVNIETGAELTEPGMKGELCIQLPSMFAGYLNRPDETTKTLRQGWLHTGDIGYIDNDGHLYVIDRLKELIKVKGFQVAPSELEDLLLTHEAIQEAAVTRAQHHILGEAPVAFVVLKADYRDSVSAKDIQDFVKARLAPYKQLAGGVHFVEQIPRLASGKILRRQLRDMLVKKNFVNNKV